MFGQLDELAPADAILASNSSSYASRMFLDKVHHPERVLNIHFYMPPKKNAVDVMSCGKTDRDVIGFVLATLPSSGLPVRSTQGEYWFHLQPGVGSGKAGVPRGCRRRRLHTPGRRRDVPARHRPAPAPSG